MTKRRKRKSSLQPAWLADWTISLKGWKVALPLAAGAWLLHHWRGVGSVALAVLVLAWTGQPLLGVAALVVIWLGSHIRPATRKARWWDQETLAAAHVKAGILDSKGDALPEIYSKGKMFSRRGQPVHTDHGTTVQVSLPQARTIDDYSGRPRKRLASALGVPENRLSIFQRPDDPANVVHIHVGTAPKAAIAPPVATMERTNWRDPVTIGYDTRGNEVRLVTFQRNSLFGGRPGYGKTSAARMVIAHFLLDPSAAVKVVDGKGSRDDYSAIMPMCETFVSGADDECVAQTLALLEDVLSEVERRNRLGGQFDGMLVVLEELQDVRADCTKPQLERLDKLLGRIIRKGRAVGVVLLILTQKPSSQDVPTGVRSQVAQGLAFHMHESDYWMALGLKQNTAPTVALPRKEGEAIWSTEGDQERVICYYMTETDWKRVCKRAKALRGPHLTLAPPPTASAAVGEGLVHEASALLADEGQLSATELHDRLSPEGLTVRDVGVELGRHPHLFTRGWSGSARVWRLTDDANLSARGV